MRMKKQVGELSHRHIWTHFNVSFYPSYTSNESEFFEVYTTQLLPSSSNYFRSYTFSAYTNGLARIFLNLLEFSLEKIMILKIGGGS